MLELIKSPWHWSVAGVLIGLTVPVLLLIGNKNFGISSSLRHVCAACIPLKIPFFNYDWKKEIWNLFFVAGVFIGGFIGSTFLSDSEPLILNTQTIQDLKALGVSDFSGMMPTDIFSWDALFSLKGFVFFVLGGFMVGFGTRYAGGCTSGHSIMGIASLQWPSIIATICFMIGGFVMTIWGLPLIFSLF
jgi:hypothetical protein